MTSSTSIVFQPRHRGAIFARLKQKNLAAQPLAANMIIMRKGVVAFHGGHSYYIAEDTQSSPMPDPAEDDLP